MKRTLFLFSLLVSFLLLSCKDDDGKQAQIRLTRATSTDSVVPDRVHSYTFNYTKEGLIHEYQETDDAGTTHTYTHSYDGSNRIQTLHVQHVSNGNLKVVHTYDAKGRIALTTHTVQHIPNHITYRAFLYDEKGRVIRITLTGNLSEGSLVTLLEYDTAGNVIKESKHETSSTGQLLPPYSETRISYDTKKNPFYLLGSPAFNYGYGFLRISYATYFSRNNPVRIEGFNQSGKIDPPFIYKYKYNQEGFPVEIRTNKAIQKLEYEIL